MARGRYRRANPIEALPWIIGGLLAAGAVGAVVVMSQKKAAAASSGSKFTTTKVQPISTTPAGSVNPTSVVLGYTNSTPATIGWSPGGDLGITVPNPSDTQNQIISVNGNSVSGDSHVTAGGTGYLIPASEVQAGATYTVVWSGPMCTGTTAGTCTYTFVLQQV